MACKKKGKTNSSSSTDPEEPKHFTFPPLQDEFLRKRIRDFLAQDQTPKNPVMQLWHKNCADDFVETFKTDYSGDVNSKELRERIRRWFRNKKRDFNNRGVPIEQLECRKVSGEDEGDAKDEGQAVPETDGDYDVFEVAIATALGIDLGFSPVSAFKSFVTENEVEIDWKVDMECKRLKASPDRRIGIFQRVRSEEFNKLSAEELRRYTDKAKIATEINKERAVRPVTDEEIFQTQRCFNDALPMILGSFVGRGRARVGDAIFRCEYVIWGENGPFTRSIEVGSTSQTYPGGHDSQWCSWAIDTLTNHVSHNSVLNTSASGSNSVADEAPTRCEESESLPRDLDLNTDASRSNSIADEAPTRREESDSLLRDEAGLPYHVVDVDDDVAPLLTDEDDEVLAYESEDLPMHTEFDVPFQASIADDVTALRNEPVSPTISDTSLMQKVDDVLSPGASAIPASVLPEPEIQSPYDATVIVGMLKKRGRPKKVVLSSGAPPEATVEAVARKKRGRPKKVVLSSGAPPEATVETVAPKKRGRPRKIITSDDCSKDDAADLPAKRVHYGDDPRPAEGEQPVLRRGTRMKIKAKLSTFSAYYEAAAKK